MRGSPVARARSSSRPVSAGHENAGERGSQRPPVSDPAVIAAAVTSGAVAVAAIVGSTVTTTLTLRHQRNAEDKRRGHERQMHLLDSGLKAAVDFLAAAYRTSRAVQGVDIATRTLSNAKSSADEKTYEYFRVKLEEAREQSYAAVADAENACATVRMLIPSVADQARYYLDLCNKANVHPDEEKDERQRARQEVEERIRLAFGGDLPANWMVAEPPSGPRWWQIRRRRAAKRASLGAVAPRQP
jgi:hypothetical protein